MTPHQILNEYFGFTDFRIGQKEIIDAILNNQNVLAVMPTGSGKSICYQIPALLKEKFSIVISPLISLMQDQVDSLNKRKTNAAFINSSLDYSEVQKVLYNIANNKINLLYVAPEKLNNPEFVTTIKNLNPHYLFIDEAHCISEWGHNFRPSYRNIKTFANAIGVENISAFTATATPEVRDDIVQQLGFKNPSVFVYGFERPNLRISVEQTKNKKERVLKILQNSEKSAIVYTSTRKNCEQVAEYLRRHKINVQYYHAGLTTELRKVIQDDFTRNNTDVIVATNAFGMGIDKKDVGTVIHYNIPGSIENLYQEFGRAGRDGKDANTYVLYSEKDKYIQEFLISLNHPTIDQIRTAYDAILDFHRVAVNSISEDPLIVDNDLMKLLETKSINQIQMNAILNNLEINKYLKISNGKFSKPSFSFLITREQLSNYIKKIKTKSYQEFILALIQYYGSIPFTRKVNINYQEIEQLLEISKNKINEFFNKLSEIGIIEVEQPNSSTKVIMMQERCRSSDLFLNTKEIIQKIEHAKEKLNSVIEYCFTDQCRFKYILNYFGEDVQNYYCGKCDNCSGSLKNNSQTDEYLAELLIRTLKEFQGGLTAPRLVGILSGKSKSQIAKSISTYQSCAHYSSAQIQIQIRRLISKRIIREINDKLFLDPIEELIESEDRQKSSDKNYESNLELFNLLREERNLAAKKFAQNPDIICSDIILKKIAQEKPTSPSALLAIDNVNQRMFNKIGLEFLSVIKAHGEKRITHEKKSGLPKHISQTYELVRKGYSLSEISKLLKLPESIVSIQIETIIAYYPADNYDNLMNLVDFEVIKTAIGQKDENLKDLKQKLPPSISYAKIRIVKSLISIS